MVATEKPEGWYSHTQQYSPPRIPYYPADLDEAAYGICNIETDKVTIELNFGQMPGYPMMVKGTISGSQFELDDGLVWSFTLHKFGNDQGAECANVGPEFNPLAEFVHGQPNIYADPSRGTIEDVTIIETPEDGSVTEQEFKQTKFMQNLEGKNSVIGRSVKVTKRVSSTEETTEQDDSKTTEVQDEEEDTIIVLGCCVIGHADMPGAVAASLEETKEQQEEE